MTNNGAYGIATITQYLDRITGALEVLAHESQQRQNDEQYRKTRVRIEYHGLREQYRARIAEADQTVNKREVDRLVGLAEQFYRLAEILLESNPWLSAEE